MNFDDARAHWKASLPLTNPTMSDNEILAAVSRRARAFDANTRKRNWREIAAGAVIVPLAALELSRSASWLARAGALLMLTGYAVICSNLVRGRRGAAMPDVTESLTAVLRTHLARVEAEIRLVQAVLWWYIAPLAIGGLLMMTGDAASSGATLVYGIVVALISWKAYTMNHRTLVSELLPKRDELTRLLQQTLG